MNARVLKSTGHWYDVIGDDGQFYKCRVRGKLRTKGLQTTNPVAAGDFVVIAPSETDEEGVASINEILPRKNYIIRKSVNLSKDCCCQYRYSFLGGDHFQARYHQRFCRSLLG